MIRLLLAGAGLAALAAPAVLAARAAVPNPLLAPWTGPYGGVPPFDKVMVDDFKPALEAAERASELGPPYGLDGDLWREVLRRVDVVAELLGDEADEEQVMDAARSLREAVHPLV